MDEPAKHGVYEVPWGLLWEKGLSIGTGQAPVKRYNVLLRDLILAGKASPDFIVSHDLPLEAAPDAYVALRQARGRLHQSHPEAADEG